MSKIASGRPLRFFVILMGGWTAIRLVSAASGMFGPPVEGTNAPVASAYRPDGRHRTETRRGRFIPARAAHMTPAVRSDTERQRLMPALMPHAIARPIPRSAAGTSLRWSSNALETTGAETFASQDGNPIPPEFNPAAVPAIPLAPSSPPNAGRWHGSAWLLWREGSATPANVVTAGRLGGSQAGLRIDYDLTPQAAGRTAAYGRVSTAMNRPASPEAALGLAWQPVRTIAISIAGERRIALGKGARDANALLIVGGFGPRPVATGLEAEAYAQAGMVGFRRKDLFVDGKFSLMAPVAHSPLRLGASVSGGAQPRVERLDVGPELQIRLPLPRVPTRLSIEWRERIAGGATPTSGVAVTLGADF
jgi:hypothetical protein